MQDNLPLHLTTLEIGGANNRLTTSYSPGQGFSQGLDHLPPSLTSLSLHQFVNVPGLDYLPRNLTFLSTASFFNLPLDHLPDSLTKLVLNSNFNLPGKFSSPSSMAFFFFLFLPLISLQWTTFPPPSPTSRLDGDSTAPLTTSPPPSKNSSSVKISIFP